MYSSIVDISQLYEAPSWGLLIFQYGSRRSSRRNLLTTLNWKLIKDQGVWFKSWNGTYELKSCLKSYTSNVTVIFCLYFWWITHNAIMDTNRFRLWIATGDHQMHPLKILSGVLTCAHHLSIWAVFKNFFFTYVSLIKYKCGCLQQLKTH